MHCFTDRVVIDVGRRGVRVNAVCPSLTRTRDRGDVSQARTDCRLHERLPLGRPAEPADVAFLASEDARFVNG